MAAELTYKDGNAQIAYFGETPWHNEGVKLTEEQRKNYDEIFQVVDFDYPLEKLPYYRPSFTPGEATPAWQPSDDTFYIRRGDTGAVLGSVGGSYEIVSNRDAFGVLKPLVDSGTATIETGGVLRDGADAWLMVKWDASRFGPNARELFTLDNIQPYSAAMVNHNGRRGVMIGNTPIRIVCANTLGAAETNKLSRWITVDHRAGAGVRLVAAAEEMFGSIVHRYEILAAQYRQLMRTALTKEAFSGLVLNVLAPLPETNPRFNPEAKLAHIVRERVETKRATVTELWINGKGHTGEKNAWYALNAAVEAIDHCSDLWPTRGGSWRTAKLLTGDLSRLKDKVTDNLVGYATAM